MGNVLFRGGGKKIVFLFSPEKQELSASAPRRAGPTQTRGSLRTRATIGNNKYWVTRRVV
jgi:hypothetical protein